MKNIKNLITTSLLFISLNYCNLEKEDLFPPVTFTSFIEKKDGETILVSKFESVISDDFFSDLRREFMEEIEEEIKEIREIEEDSKEIDPNDAVSLKAIEIILNTFNDYFYNEKEFTLEKELKQPLLASQDHKDITLIKDVIRSHCEDEIGIKS